MAVSCDSAEGSSILVYPIGPHGTLPRASLRCQSSTTIQMARAGKAPPSALSHVTSLPTLFLKLYPPLFERVKAKVQSGQFHLIGGSWVENDSNMPSGEALARQMIFGQRYFQSRFGKRCDTAWLPDSFGLTGALPQLIRGAGMNYFFTQKLSW